MSADLDKLCAAARIERVYRDQFGTERAVSPETIRAIAKVLGVFESDDAGASADVVAPATICFADEVPQADLSLPAEAADEDFTWTLIEESGRKSTGSFRTGELERREIAPGQARRRLLLPVRLESGYHSLAIRSTHVAAETALIVAPRRAFLPPSLESGPGIWGLAAQLYSLRSARDWGMGDFGTLAAFIRAAADAGAGAVGINPLHALMPDEPERASPYSPSSRAYLNALYIDIEAVPDFAESAEAQAHLASAAVASERQRLREAAFVDYAGVAVAKLPVLEKLHASFRRRHVASSSPRAADFAAFLEREGEPLRRFCVFQALRESRGAADHAQRDWRRWPAELADPASPEVAAFAAANATRIEFFSYCQWIARAQLAACAAVAREAGMTIGLYGDLAVGVDAAAGEAWAAQDVIVPGWSIGAPPDAWNRRGQDWGLSPVSPAALRCAAYRPFAALLRANMRDFGALRIDHILGLWRSFWIPHGQAPTEGAYVRNPFADLVAILTLESQRARCVVIGEDLGTVPPGLREALQAAGVLSYRLLYFEHGPGGRRARAEDYPRLALVAVGTHDLPPLAGFWAGSDIAARRDSGQYDGAQEAEADLRRRGEARDAFLSLWREAGFDVGGAVPVLAAHRFLARSPGRILMVQIEDALGLAEPINVPGTPDAAPNWRRRLPVPVERLFADERVRALADALNAERPSTRSGPP